MEPLPIHGDSTRLSTTYLSSVSTRRLLLPMLLGLFAAGCRTEKLPPSVEWLSPTSSPQWAPDVNVPLRFVLMDPAPERGTTAPASWRVEVGPTGGGLWWTASGDASAAPSTGSPAHIDTIDLQWTVPFPPASATGPIDLLLTAIITDGEGGRGADFTSASVAVPPLESAGLWHVDPDAALPIRFFPTAPLATNQALPSPCSAVRDLVHLDGRDRIVLGCATSLEALDTHPADDGSAPVWTIPAPLSAQTGGLRFLRRTPTEWTTSAWAMAGWPDRVQWVDGDGQIQKSWVLESGETLIDAGVIDGRMILLARTATNELRLIRCNLDNGARIASITWTPEAPGSTGPTGDAWLLNVDGEAAGLEQDGTWRRWFIEPDGNTGLSTSESAGSGEVIAAGILDDGTSWVAREETRLLRNPILSIGDPALRIEENRADGIFWVLRTDQDQGLLSWERVDAWSGVSVPSVTPAPPSTPVPASVAHNRPGPP
jgi:hypothetical protein